MNLMILQVIVILMLDIVLEMYVIVLRTQKTKNNVSSAKGVTFSSSDQLHRARDPTKVLGGNTRTTQNTFDLLAERCHGGKSKIASPQSSDSPGSTSGKTNYVLETPSSIDKCLVPNSPPAMASENNLRKLSLTSKVKKDQKLAVGRQFSDADLASAVAVASAAAGKSLHTNIYTSDLQRQKYFFHIP